MNTFISIFDNAQTARRAMAILNDSGLTLSDLSVISRADDQEIEVSSADDVTASQGATVGAVWGGLVGLAALVIPGVGPFIAGGAFASALAGVATGAVTGAAVGGVSAALINFGSIPEEEAGHYESLVYSGKTLVAGKARAEHMRHVRRIIKKAGGDTLESDTTGNTAVASTSSSTVKVYDEKGREVEHRAEDSESDTSPLPPSI